MECKDATFPQTLWMSTEAYPDPQSRPRARAINEPLVTTGGDEWLWTMEAQ